MELNRLDHVVRDDMRNHPDLQDFRPPPVGHESQLIQYRGTNVFRWYHRTAQSPCWYPYGNPMVIPDRTQALDTAYAVGDWREMESAPKDGSEFIAFGARHVFGSDKDEYTWTGCRWSSETFGFIETKPTGIRYYGITFLMWMPLPPPPKVKPIEETEEDDS